MRFKTLGEEKPKTGIDLLIKYKTVFDSGYYIVRYYAINGAEYFEEACGEQYCVWRPHEVIGWMYASELDSL